MSQANNAVQVDINLPITREPALRSPSEMMSESRVSCAINNALSFSRTGMRELLKGRWKVVRDRFDLDADGRGEVLYRLTDGHWEFHFYLLSNKLPEDQKLDRNFAGTWEAMGVLCEGEWTSEREAHLRTEIPKQVAGRSDYDTLTYVRGNRSGRLFQYVVDCLADGRQPDARQIASVGYILRTTAFIANGQLGTRPLAGYDPGHPMRRPYHAQIWSAFLLREYVFDLVEHMARAINPLAASLSPDIRRYLGLGNSAATGLVPFVANHPLMIHRWVEAQESAMTQARFRTLSPSSPESDHFLSLLKKAIQYFKEHDAPPCGFFVPSKQIAQELSALLPMVAEFRNSGMIAGVASAQPWLALHTHLSAAACRDTVEAYNAILLELYPDIVDEYTDAFLAEEKAPIDPAMPVGRLLSILDAHYDWVLDDVESEESEYYFWYRAEAAPFDLRRGVKGVVPELERETPMDTVRLTRDLLSELEQHAATAPILDILMLRPNLRHIIGRVQNIARAPYGELRINLLKKSFSPFGPVRFVLSFYGMEKFEGANPKVVRGAFLQGAPIAQDIEEGLDGSWPFPLIPRNSNTRAGERAVEPAVAARSVKSDMPPAQKAFAAASTTLVTAPVELKRLIQASLHGAGLELGVAEDMAEIVLFHEAANSPQRSFLPAMLERDFSQAGGRPGFSIDGQALVIDAAGASSLQVACHAIDWVCCRSLTSQTGASLALVNRTKDAGMLDHLAQRCAAADLFGILLWRGGDTYGLALSAPGRDGVWMIRGKSHGGKPTHHQALNEQAATLMAIILADTPPIETDDVMQSILQWSEGDWGDALEDVISSINSRADPGSRSTDAELECFALLGLKMDREETIRLFDRLSRLSPRDVPADEAAVHAYTAEDLRYNGWQRHRRGIVVDREHFAALAESARRILVPDTEEHRLRPGEVINPLKIF